MAKLRFLLSAFLCVCLFSLYGQENTSSSNNQKEWLPFKGGIEACRQFFNENLKLDLVTNTNLPKGRLQIICIIDTLGRVKTICEPAQYYDKNNTRLKTYDKTNIGKEFFRVANLAPWDLSMYKNEKKTIRFFIDVTIPYIPDDPNSMRFMKMFF